MSATTVIDQKDLLFPEVVNDLYAGPAGRIVLAVIEHDELQWINGPTGSTQVTFRKSKFLVAQRREDAITELEARANEATRELAELRKARDGHDAELAQVKARAYSAEVRCTDVCKQANDDRAQIRMMEADLAKIRRAVGEIRMKEILGADI